MKERARAEPNCGNYNHRCINESSFEGSEVRRKLILSEEEKVGEEKELVVAMCSGEMGMEEGEMKGKVSGKWWKLKSYWRLMRFS
jgi:hypothetical protein